MTNPKTTIPIIKSGTPELNILTNTAATITPTFIIISLDVKIILARICASVLLDFCNKYKQIPLAIKASIETIIIVENTGNASKA